MGFRQKAFNNDKGIKGRSKMKIRYRYLEIEIPDDDEDWTPDQLIWDRLDYLDSFDSSPGKQVA